MPISDLSPHGLRVKPMLNSHFIAALIWLLISVTSVFNTVHAFRPTRHRLFFVPSFFSSLLVLELAGHHIVFLILGAAAVTVYSGASELLVQVALGLNALSIALLAVHIRTSQKAHHVLTDALKGYIDSDTWPKVPVSQLIFPFRPKRAGTRRTKNIEYARLSGRSLQLDVFEPENRTNELRPAIIQIHGGAWVIGNKDEQGLPLLYHLASQGWVGFSPNYRLSPGATFPDHLIDVKRAIAWVREHAEEYHIDPNFIAITGGSAGGHLTALAALTINDPKYQPEFEDADTSVQAAIPFYGVYDFTDRLRLLGREFVSKFLEPVVMKAFLEDEPEKFIDASPLSILHADAPPMLIIHGDKDVLAPVEYARLFAKELGEVSKNNVFYAEMPGAQHAFELFSSTRTNYTVESVERFLHAAYTKHPQDAQYQSPFAQQKVSEDSSLPVV